MPNKTSIQSPQQFEEQLERFITFLDGAMKGSLNGGFKISWPLRIRVWGGAVRYQAEEEVQTSRYEYQYPLDYFWNLQSEKRLFLKSGKKSNRKKVLILLIDKLKAGEIDIHLFHFGLFLVYGNYDKILEEDLESIGKRRFSFYLAQPVMSLMSSDDYLTLAWGDLVESWYPEVGAEYIRNPKTTEVRMLFTSEQFGHHFGAYFSEAEWVEPISAARNYQVRKYMTETDPMLPKKNDTALNEGKIILGHEGGSGLRHFVNGQPVRSGSSIRVKFGDGWISGRYEWSFHKGDPIEVHSNRNSFFTIKEGHLVRI